MPNQFLSITEVIKLSCKVCGVENQDSHEKMGVSSQCMQLCVCLLYVCICGCFVNGVCNHGVLQVHVALLASRRTAMQCLSIIEVIKLSG